MENPRLTFATPTIIAGDRSLVSLVAHELAHSWSGNLVTNATWDDFWLNEGFTVYFEQRIMESVYGRDVSEMLATLSYQGLVDEVDAIMDLNPDDTHLKLHLQNRDPDDGLTAIAYDKGYFFLRRIEEVVGREAQVEGVEDGAHRGHPDVGLEVAMVVPQEARHAIPGLDAGCHEGARGPKARAAQLREGEACTGVLDRHGLRVALGGQPQQLREGLGLPRVALHTDRIVS